MGNLVNIAFQGGTHGHYLRFCIDKFSELTPKISGSPFTDNYTSHANINYSNQIGLYHPHVQYPHFENLDEPHILITVSKEDILFIERWVTMRAGDHKVDVTQKTVSTHSNFLNSFPWADKFKKIYNIDIKKNKIPKFVIRDFYKLSFLDTDKNGFIEFDKKLRKNKPENTFCFPVSNFWNKNIFFETLEKAGLLFNLKLDTRDKSTHDEFLNGLKLIDTKNRANMVIEALIDKRDIDITNLDTVEQAYVSAWLEKNNDFVTVPLCDQFFESTGEIMCWLKNYPEHYKAMNPNLPTFNNIPNPFHLWTLKK